MKTITAPTPNLARTPAGLRRFTKLVASLTFFLIFAGAMVTSTGSGLAVPDWPTTYGTNMFTFPLSKWVGGIFYEHGHRLIAATVGFLVVIQAIWLQLREPKRFLRTLGWCSLGAVIAQGVLGGLTVIFLLPHAISVAHAGLAEIFLCLNVSIAFFASDLYGSLRTTEKGDAPVGASAALVLLVYAQILAGALMRHLGAGLAIPDFPTSFGHLVPSFTSAAIAVNFAHRLGAVVVVAAIVAMFFRLRRFEAAHPLRQLATMLLVVVTAQVVLGAYTVWSGKHPFITSLHVVTGAATLAVSLLLALTARTVGWRLEGGRKADALVSPRNSGSFDALRNYLELSKSRIVLMVLITTAAGYFFGAKHFELALFVNTLIGTALVAAGTNALNQYVERDHDAKMRRTQKRPLPAGRIAPGAALLFASAIAIVGTAYLALTVNVLTAILGAFTLTSYIFVYTPLKRVSTACTIIGAIPGAIPPLMGWTAATNALSLGGWIVFAILFFWQLPHFMAISWMYREDYGRAGFRMLSVDDADGSAVARQAIGYSAILLAVSLLPQLFRLGGPPYTIAAALFGLALLSASIAFRRERSPRNARRLFMLSNVYLIVVMSFLVL